MDRLYILLISEFDRQEVHRRPARCFGYRFSIICVVFVRLDEGFYEEYPYGTLKAWMGSTHFLPRTLNRVSTEMSLHVLAYNLTGKSCTENTRRDDFENACGCRF